MRKFGSTEEEETWPFSSQRNLNILRNKLLQCLLLVPSADNFSQKFKSFVTQYLGPNTLRLKHCRWPTYVTDSIKSEKVVRQKCDVWIDSGICAALNWIELDIGENPVMNRALVCENSASQIFVLLCMNVKSLPISQNDLLSTECLS